MIHWMLRQGLFQASLDFGDMRCYSRLLALTLCSIMLCSSCKNSDEIAFKTYSYQSIFPLYETWDLVLDGNNNNLTYGDLMVGPYEFSEAEDFFHFRADELYIDLYIPYEILFPEQPVAKGDLPVRWNHNGCEYAAVHISALYFTDGVSFEYIVEARCPTGPELVRYLYSSERGLISYIFGTLSDDGQTFEASGGYVLVHEATGLGARSNNHQVQPG